ncbi:Lrp/AsnC family transcriptional regulator [Halegenticoccus tardaugens]|uniref:Lrp/AsnC family transcriptional regulator n=1 Tax=Halegenticoccus tardaugens TaxID=2071624 RepID=UPI00100B9914|nr:Lrp/AsnC ligand binding domain-containing protein [Halegenticoccus tardaugens]
MVTAYVMVKANTGEADRLKAEMVDIEGVVDTHIVAGDVDFIVKVDVDAPGAVKDVVATRIQAIDGIEGTQTYISMD